MKRRTLALILAAALTVTSVEGTAVMASAAEFTSEAVEETEAELETAPEDSADVAVLSDQGDSSESDEIEISDSESQDSDSAEEQIDVFEETQDGADEEGIEITDEEALTDADAENEETNIEVFSDGDESTPTLTGMEVEGINENTMRDGVAGIDYYVAVQITLKFADDTTSEFIFPLGETSYCDAEKTKGYTIRVSLRRGPAGEDLMGQKLPKGNYYLYFKCDEDETITADIPAYIHNLEEDGVCQSEIMTGETPVISFRNAYRYYKFVPQRAGIYQGSTSSAYCIPWIEDKSAGESTSYKIYKKLEGSRWELKANEPVYFQVYGGDKDDSSNETATITLSEVPQLESISTTQSEVTLLENYETWYGEAISRLLRFNYTNQEPKDFDVKFGYATYRDPDGNIVMSDLVYADGENKGKSFDWRNNACVPKGSYTYIFTLEKDGQELMKVKVPIKVESLADRYAQLNSIKEGTQEIDITNRQFYKFEPEVSGDYMISAETGLSYLVIEVKEDGTTERLNEINGRVLYKLEQGHKYIIDIYNHTTDTTSTNLTLKRLAKTKSVEIISYMPQEIKCIEGQKPEFNFIKVRINTEKGSEVRKLNYGGISGVETDSYGKTLEYSLYKKENDQYKEVYNPEAGEYVYRVFYDGIEAMTSIPVHIASFEEVAPQDSLEEGESKTLSAKDNQISARYLANFTGRHRFEFNKKVNVYCVGDTGTSKTYSNVSEFCEKLVRGNAYYLYITSDTGLEDLQVKVTELQKPVKLEILADKNEYIAGIDDLSNINLRTRVTYSDGSEQVIGMNDPVYGGMLSYRASTEGGKTAEYYSLLTEGEWNCVPYIYGQGNEISLSGTEIIGTTIKVTMPNAENLEKLEEGASKTVEPVKRKFYKFIPKTSAGYEVKVSDGATVNVYSVYNGRLLNHGSKPTLTEDVTYFVMVSTPYSVDLQIKKREDAEDDGYVMDEKYDQTFDLNDMHREEPPYFTFKPTETGYYKFWTEGNVYPYVALYEEDEKIGEVYPYAADNVVLTAKLEKGKTYGYLVIWDPYEGSNLTVHFAKTEHQSIKSLELVLKKGATEDAMTVMNGVLDVYDLRINYADHSTLVEAASEFRSWGSYDCEGSDEYGNKWKIFVDNSEAVLEAKDTKYKIKLAYYDPEEENTDQNTVWIPVKGIEGMKAIENGTSVKPFQNSGVDAYFTFTPSESGEYIMQFETEDGEAMPYAYAYSYNVQYSDFQSIEVKDVSAETLNEKSVTAMLTGGETYLVEVDRRSMECNGSTSFKIEKAKTVKSVEIKNKPDQKTVYNTDGNIEASLEGLILTVYYKDGTKEDVAYGENDAAGYGITVEDRYWKDAGTYTVTVSLRKYYLQVDYKRVDIPGEIQTVNTGISTKLPASDQVVVPVMFTPEKTGYYFVDVENGSVSSVQKLETQESAQARMRGTGTSSNAGDTQYFEADTSYMIYIYTNKKESTVTIREGACKWETIAGTIVKASCTTGASCKQECKVHNHTRVVEGDKAAGHGYSSWKVTREADCTRAGEKQRRCVYCGHVEKVQTEPAKGHKYGYWKTTKESTVLNTGQKERICCVCKKKEKKSIAKLKATISLNVSGTIPLKTRQTFTARVTMGKGDRVVSWKSSNTRVVSVDKNGKVKGLRAGKTATITVQLRSGLKKSFKVNVQNANVATRSLQVTNASTRKRVSSRVSLKRRQTLKLAVTLSPITSRERVEYFSSDKRIVSVSSRGVIRANRTGRAIITVKSGRKIYRIRITVK